jgi:hypothetical protein
MGVFARVTGGLGSSYGLWVGREGQTAVCPYGVYGFLVDGVGITSRLAGS